MRDAERVANGLLIMAGALLLFGMFPIIAWGESRYLWLSSFLWAPAFCATVVGAAYILGWAAESISKARKWAHDQRSRRRHQRPHDSELP